jgi:Fe-S cluster assembly protein SufD
MTQTADKNIQWYLSSFEAFERGLNGESNLPIHVLRKAAMARFVELGFPTAKNEEWRFTNIAPIAKTQFKPTTLPSVGGVTREAIEKFTFGGMKCNRLVFLNGHFVDELSSIAILPKGAIVASLAMAVKRGGDLLYKHLGKHVKGDENGFTALNVGFMQDGAFVYISDGVAVEEPIHLLFVSTGGESSFVTTPRNLIIAGRNSQLSIVESYVSLAGVPYLTNTVTEMVVGERSVIEHDKLQDESLNAFHVGTTHFQQFAGSSVVSNSIALGGSIVRNNVTSVLAGEGIECTLNGLSLATGQQLVDNHTAIDHAKPNCVSHELYKSVLDGTSRGVFNGKIFVRKDAQKTDAKQTNKTLLLSDDATMDTKPQLEIFADDVKCTHGATVGQLDEEQVFYLRSRGISLDTARDILTVAFANDVVNRIHVDALREQLDAIIQKRLRKGRELVEA